MLLDSKWNSPWHIKSSKWSVKSHLVVDMPLKQCRDIKKRSFLWQTDYNCFLIVVWIDLERFHGHLCCFVHFISVKGANGACYLRKAVNERQSFRDLWVMGKIWILPLGADLNCVKWSKCTRTVLLSLRGIQRPDIVLGPKGDSLKIQNFYCSLHQSLEL